MNTSSAPHPPLPRTSWYGRAVDEIALTVRLLMVMERCCPAASTVALLFTTCQTSWSLGLRRCHARDREKRWGFLSGRRRQPPSIVPLGTWVLMR